MDTHSDEVTSGSSEYFVRLRPEIRFSPADRSAEPDYTVEDKVDRRYFRVGWSEYLVLSVLDGKANVDRTIDRLRGRSRCRLTDDEIRSVCNWAIKAGLASASTTPWMARDDSEETASDEPARKPRKSWTVSPLYIRIPLLNPDQLLDRIQRVTSWIHSPIAVAVAALIILVSGIMAAGSRDELVLQSQGILSSSNWLWIGASWILLKAVHEFGHASACKKYGGRVPEAGVIFILFAPLAYVDVSSAWRFTSRWQRVHVAAAGIITDLLVASIAIQVWMNSESESIRHLCYVIAWTASVGTLLFNANPLMKFDGYFVLSHALDLPNLAQDARRFLTSLSSRVLLGVRSPDPLGDCRLRTVIRVYAVLALGWRLFVAASLLIVASLLFHGAGLILVALVVGGWCVHVARKGIEVWKAGRRGLIHPVRAFCGVAVAVGLVLGLLTLRTPRNRVAPGIVDFAETEVLRADSSGFVARVLVADGQQVTAGQPLMILRNDELEVELLELELSIEVSQVRSRLLASKDDQAGAQAELANETALRKRFDEKSRIAANLRVTAPVDGRVMARGLDSRLGQFIEPGEELLRIGDDSRREFQVLIDQDDLQTYSGFVGRSVNGRLRGLGTFTGELDRIEPRARDTVHHDALSARNGGLLDVRPSKDEMGDPLQAPVDELTSPRFLATVLIDDSTLSGDLASGQVGIVRVTDSDQTLAQNLYEQLDDWYQTRVRFLTDQKLASR